MLAFVSTLVLFFLVLDPIGNLPLFITTLEPYSGARYRRIVLRESVIALGILLLFLICGERILQVLNISNASLQLAGGVILFMIAINMVFGKDSNLGRSSEEVRREPLIVPLAIPFVAGPAALSTAILVGGRGVEQLPGSLVALGIAWFLSTLILLVGRFASRLLGKNVLSGIEALMGLLLTAMAVEMVISGIRFAFQIGS